MVKCFFGLVQDDSSALYYCYQNRTLAHLKLETEKPGMMKHTAEPLVHGV